MPDNDDLFAGFTVGNKQIPTQQQQDLKSSGVDLSNEDLFSGFNLDKAEFVGPGVGQQLEGPALPGEQVEPVGARVELSPFPEKPGETLAAEKLPEVTASGILAGEDSAKVAALSPVLLTTTNPEEFANILKTNFPEAIGVQFSPGGEVIVANNKTGVKAIVNKEGFSAIDALQTLGLIAAFTPAARGVSLLAKAPALVPTAAAVGVGRTAALAGAGAAGAGATQAGIEVIQQQLGGELNEEEIQIAAALGGVAEVVVPAIQAIRQSRQAGKLGVETAEREVTRQVIEPAKEAVEALKQATGVEVGLFGPQQTQVPSELLKQRLLPQLDAGAKKAATALERQNKEVFEATSELLNTIAGPETAISGAGRFRTAAQQSLTSAVESRSEAVRPLYKEAFRLAKQNDESVNLKPVLNFVNTQLRGLVADDPAAIALRSFAKRLKGKETIVITKGALGPDAVFKTGTKETITEPLTLEQLQSAKRTVDAKIEKMGGLILNSAQKNAKRLLIETEKRYMAQIGKVNPQFLEANAEFARLSGPIADLENSILGAVSKVKDVDLQNISRRIFSPNSNPAVIKNAKEIIDKVDPGAWDDMLRTELQRRFGGIETLAEDIPGELVGNVPGQLRRAIFGNPEQRRTLLSAMNSDQRKNFVYLDQVLKRASSGRQAGSPTAPFGEVLDRLKGAAGVLRDVIFRPLDTLQRTGERSLFDRNVAALTDVLFDTRFAPQLNKLRKLDPNSPAAARALTQLINQSNEKENK